jgi:hypothetical protein
MNTLGLYVSKTTWVTGGADREVSSSRPPVGQIVPRLAATVAIVLVLVPPFVLHDAAAEEPASALPLTGDAAEDFLSTAKVLELKTFKAAGVTMPRKATLSDGERTLDALFKDIDTYLPRGTLSGGEVVFRFRDSYRHEIAAYELDKLLGLAIVPPCVKRRISSEVGALCLWLEGTITEWERLEQPDAEPPDTEDWDRQMMTIRLFLQLIYDLDYKNVANLLIDERFKIYKIDSSRAFRTDRELRDPAELTRFSSSVLEALGSLTSDDVQASLKPWLNKDQIKGLMARRDLILELAEARVAALGEDEVLYP